MKKLLIVLVMIGVLIAACGGDNPGYRILGTWEIDGEEFTFKEDGIGLIEMKDGSMTDFTYVLKDGEATLCIDFLLLISGIDKESCILDGTGGLRDKYEFLDDNTMNWFGSTATRK